MKNIVPNLLAAAALAFCGTALAQKAGTFSASIGFTTIAPSANSGDLTATSLPNTKVDVNSNSQITGAVSYMVTDHVAIHVPLGFGFKHQISGADAITGVGKLVDAKALPITVIGQYRFFDANATFRPDVGAGVSYVKFYNEKGTGVSFKSNLAPTLQIGGTYNINEKWYIDASYTKTFLKTRARLTTGPTIDVTLDPNAYSVQVGYKF